MIRFVSVLVLASFLSAACTPESPQAETAGDEYADVMALEGTAKAELLAFARLLRKNPSMAIDFTHLEQPQHCLNTGGDMLHVADDPSAKIPLAYLHPAAPLVEAGLDVTKLPEEPETLAALEPNRWYYYPGGRVEPLHGKTLGGPMLIRTVGP